MIIIPSLPDPIISCDFDDVYTPSDDSYLLLDFFKNHISHTNFDGINMNEIEKILDLGTGTGIVAIFFQLLKKKFPDFNPRIYASDILGDAIKCARNNEILNQINNQITFIHSDLFTSFPENLKHSFNIIVFNPPYLPSLDLIKKNGNIIDRDYSWNGGLKGYETIVHFLENAKDFLNLEKNHHIYCITSNRINLIELDKIIKELNYNIKIIGKKHIFFEDILLNKLTYKTH